jgi:hypothetical protein
MLDAILDELQAIFAELRAAVKELDTRLSEAYYAFRDRLGQAPHRLGYRLQGKDYEPEDWE